ncbi:MAG: NTP transferase domain-containing protein [Oscillospiraceae bacterium]|jgi:bifunctional UDP-N-acetylglucosamine pyrophosphorylase/glucosamine-1-phosphate N-acetyltransferase|nr:NTP transferase domain-containing protein [Oscillospiraceae bacterium]
MSTCGVVLAGGEGKRMKSDLPKTLSLVLGKPMLQWVIDSLKGAGVSNICVVKGFKKEAIEDYVNSLSYPVKTVYQAERLGTGHAVMMAEDFLCKNGGDCIVLNGDAPFMDSQTIADALKLHRSGDNAATLISAEIADPTGYGRVVRDADGNLQKIVEQKDADEATLKVCEVNSGAYWFNTRALLSVLNKITSNNSAKEYYLPDALKLLIAQGQKVSVFTASSPNTVLGANDPAQLEELNEIARKL